MTIFQDRDGQSHKDLGNGASIPVVRQPDGTYKDPYGGNRDANGNVQCGVPTGGISGGGGSTVSPIIPPLTPEQKARKRKIAIGLAFSVVAALVLGCIAFVGVAYSKDPNWAMRFNSTPDELVRKLSAKVEGYYFRREDRVSGLLYLTNKGVEALAPEYLDITFKRDFTGERVSSASGQPQQQVAIEEFSFKGRTISRKVLCSLYPKEAAAVTYLGKARTQCFAVNQSDNVENYPFEAGKRLTGIDLYNKLMGLINTDKSKARSLGVFRDS
jgi:hypothetical protein